MLKAPAVPSTGAKKSIGTGGGIEMDMALAKVEQAMRGIVAKGESLDSAWQNLISTAQKLGLEGSEAFVKLILKMREAGKESKALTEYVQGQLGRIPDALSSLIANAEKSGTSLKNLGTVALTSFNAMTSSGMSFFDAIQAMQDPLAALREKYKKLGLEADPALKKLFNLAGIVGKNKELFDSISANKTILEALGNSGFLTADALKAITGNATAYYEKLQKAGMSSGEALRAMAPTLQEIYDYSKAYGITLDKNTLKLIEEAKAAGIVKDKVDIGTVLTTVNDTLDKMYKLWCKIYGVVDDTAKRAGDIGDGTGAGGGGTGRGKRGGGDGREPGETRWASGFEGIVRRPIRPLIGEKGPEYVSVQPVRSATPLSPGRSSNVNLTFNISALDGADLETVTRRKVVPILQDVLDHYGMTVRTGGVRG
jgi:hypothetical protein